MTDFTAYTPDTLSTIRQTSIPFQAPSSAKNPALIYLASLSALGRRSMAGRLRAVSEAHGSTVESFPWARLRYEHIAAIRAQLQSSGLAPATINATLYALRGAARAAFNLGITTAETYERIRSVRPVTASRLPTGRSLSVAEIGAVLATCTEPVMGIRDAAIITLLYTTGIQRTEAVMLDTSDFDADKRELRVQGKGNRERLLYVHERAAEALREWISVRGDQAGPLFNPVRKGGTIQPRRMTDQAMYHLLNKRAKQARINKFSPHDLRRSFISELLDRGADISTVQQLAGHASISTTSRYDRRGELAKRRAISLLQIPN